MSAAAAEQHCPKCGAQVARPAREGGLFLRSRFIRLHEDRTTTIGCPGCATELEVRRGRLLLFRRPDRSGTKLTTPEKQG